MKLQEIKTELFTRGSENMHGFKLDIFDENGRKQPQSMWPMYLMSIHILKTGGINVSPRKEKNNHITLEQLNEITRVANILKEEKNSKTYICHKCGDNIKWNTETESFYCSKCKKHYT